MFYMFCKVCTKCPFFTRNCMTLHNCVVIFTCVTDGRYVNWTLQLASAHGPKAVLPFVKSVEVNTLNLESNFACFLLLDSIS